MSRALPRSPVCRLLFWLGGPSLLSVLLNCAEVPGGPNRRPFPPTVAVPSQVRAADPFQLLVWTGDLDGDDVRFRVRFATSQEALPPDPYWSIYLPSGCTLPITAAFVSPCSNYVEAQAKDFEGETSAWCDPLGFEVQSRRRWRVETEGEASSPAIGLDGTVYASTGTGCIYAVTPDGTVRATRRVADARLTAPAVGADGTVFLGACDGRLYALGPDCQVSWSFLTGGNELTMPGIGADGSVYFGSDDSFLYALDGAGQLEWSYKTGAPVRSSPAIGPDGTIYFGSDDGCFHALEPGGAVKWCYQMLDPIRSSPALGPDGTVYFGSEGGRLCAMRPVGRPKWFLDTQGPIQNPVIVSPDGEVGLCSGDGVFYVLSPAGETLWSMWTGGAKTPTLVAGSTVIFGLGEDAEAVVLGGDVLWFEACGGPTTEFTVAEDGTTYCGAGSAVLCFEGLGLPETSSWPTFRHDRQRTGRAVGAWVP